MSVRATVSMPPAPKRQAFSDFRVGDFLVVTPENNPATPVGIKTGDSSIRFFGESYNEYGNCNLAKHATEYLVPDQITINASFRGSK